LTGFLRACKRAARTPAARTPAAADRAAGGDHRARTGGGGQGEAGRRAGKGAKPDGGRAATGFRAPWRASARPGGR